MLISKSCDLHATTFLSEVHLGDELRIVSGDRYTLFVVKGHQNETKEGM